MAKLTAYEDGRSIGNSWACKTDELLFKNMSDHYVNARYKTDKSRADYRRGLGDGFNEYHADRNRQMNEVKTNDQWRIVKKNILGQKETFLYSNWEDARVQIQALHSLENVWYQVFSYHNYEWKKLDMPWMY